MGKHYSSAYPDSVADTFANSNAVPYRLTISEWDSWSFAVPHLRVSLAIAWRIGALIGDL